MAGTWIAKADRVRWPETNVLYGRHYRLTERPQEVLLGKYSSSS